MFVQQWPVFYQAISVVHQVDPTYTDQPTPADFYAIPVRFQPYFLGDLAVIHQIDATYQDGGNPPSQDVPLQLFRVPYFLGDSVMGDEVAAAVVDDGMPHPVTEPHIPMWPFPPFYLSYATDFTEQPEAGEPGFIANDHQFLPLSLIPYFLGSLDVVHDIEATYTDWDYRADELPRQVFLQPFYLGDSTLYTEAPEAGDQTPRPGADPNFWMWALPYYPGSATYFTEVPESGEPGFIADDHQFLPLSLIPYFLSTLDVVHQIDTSYEDGGNPPSQDFALQILRAMVYLGDFMMGDEVAAAVVDDATPYPAADPVLWMWALPYFLGTATDFTEQPEVGDQTWLERAEAATWMWTVPHYLSSLDIAHQEAAVTDDGFPYPGAEANLWTWTVPYFLGSLDVVHEIDATYADEGTPPSQELFRQLFQTFFYLGESSQFMELPEAGDFVPHPAAEPNLWAWTVPYFLGETSQFTEEPEVGDLVPHPSAEAQTWRWTIPYYLSSFDIAQEELAVVDDGFPHPGAEPNLWERTVPYFLGDVSQFTETPEAGDLTWLERAEAASWMWTIPYFLSSVDIVHQEAAVTVTGFPPELIDLVTAQPVDTIILGDRRRRWQAQSILFEAQATLTVHGRIVQTATYAAPVLFTAVGQAWAAGRIFRRWSPLYIQTLTVVGSMTAGGYVKQFLGNKVQFGLSQYPDEIEELLLLGIIDPDQFDGGR